jgi:hypothetical protein
MLADERASMELIRWGKQRTEEAQCDSCLFCWLVIVPQLKWMKIGREGIGRPNNFCFGDVGLRGHPGGKA